jgi:hypothetical protein
MSKVSKTSTATWSVTRYRHLYRHRSGTYYARLAIQGKKTWRSLKTNLLSIAQPRLAKLLEEERERAERAGINKVARGSMSMAEANEIQLQEIKNDASLKKSTIEYFQLIHQGVYKSWPELAAKDIREVTQDECREWAGRFARSMSPTVFNNSLAVLRKILEVGIEAGLRTTNPAGASSESVPARRNSATSCQISSNFAPGWMRSAGGKAGGRCTAPTWLSF